MSKIDLYRQILRDISDWPPFLLRESNLPGPRGNLELAHAAALEGSLEIYAGLLTLTPDQAPTNTPEEFLTFCGVLGLGRLAGEGQVKPARIRPYASDPRWRTREAAAMALQLLGDRNPALLVDTALEWAAGSLLEKRAAVAALCEPRLLKDARVLSAALDVLDQATQTLADLTGDKTEDFKTLRKGLAYGWSVAVAAGPAAGKPRMERWMESDNRQVRWVMRENLKKNRLKQMDARWVEQWSRLF